MAKRDDVPGLGDRLKQARVKCGFTQTQAGGASGVHQTNISEFEQGLKTPTLATLIRLAVAYRVSLSDLVPLPGVRAAETAPPPESTTSPGPSTGQKTPKKTKK